MDTKKRKRYLSFGLLLVLLIIYLLFFRQQHDSTYSQSARRSIDHREKKFRHNRIYYTKHARCRMDCRHIDESEIREMLDKGKINYAKSELSNSPCPTYALEGFTHDQQHVRIIVGDCDSQASIITVIDLETDFKCDCK